MCKTLWYRLEIPTGTFPTGTKEAARLHQRGSLKGTGWFFQPVPMGAKGTGWNTRYSRPKPMVSVCGCRLENRYLRASSTGVEGPFSSSGCCQSIEVAEESLFQCILKQQTYMYFQSSRCCCSTTHHKHA